MKMITTLLISGLIAISGVAEANTVTLIFKGISSKTNNYQVSIDGKSYYSNTNLQTGQVAINDLSLGKHTLKVYKLKYNSSRYNGRTKNTLVYTKVFELRQGYNMNITVQNNGKILFSEDETSVTYPGNTPNTGMSVSNFNALVQNISNNSSQYTRASIIENALTNSNNYFTTNQIRQLLTMITSESSRFDLAKLSYNNVTDRTNFETLINLFNSTSYRNQFNNYIKMNGGQVVANTGQQMSDYQFSSLLQDVRGKWSQASKGEAIHDAFENQSYYFSTAQVRELVSLISSESDRLELVKQVKARVVDQSNYGTLADLFSNTYYRDQFYTYAGVNGTAGQAGTKTQLSDYQFNSLLQSVRNQWSQSLKEQTIRDALTNTSNYFSTSQIRQLLGLVSSETDRLQLVKLAYQQTVDPANFSSLVDLFTTTAYRNEFNNYVYSQGGTTAPARTPMAAADFDMLVLGVRANLIQPLKINAEANIFNNQSYFFTTAQVHELISLINSEDSRLDLAKLAYRSVTDKENYSQMNDLFNTQANRDALATYVKGYTE